MDSLRSNLVYWLVQNPLIGQFEWKQGQTYGSSPLFLALSLLSYLSLTFLFLHSPRLLPSLPPNLLRPISAVHNLLLLLLSLIMAVGCSLSIHHQLTPHHRWIFCFPSNRTPPRGPLFFWAYVFYLSKILEFVDTLLIFLGLGGGIRRLSFLHVYHHATVVVMCYVWLQTSQSLFPVALVTNAAVHTLMYSYYFLCAVGRRPRWKRAVTEIQISQFVFSFGVSAVMLYYHVAGGGCSGFLGWCFNAVFNASLLALFLDFRTRNYAGWRRGGRMLMDGQDKKRR